MSTVSRVVELLTKTRWMRTSEVVERSGLGRSTAFNALRRAVEQQKVETHTRDGVRHWRRLK